MSIEEKKFLEEQLTWTKEQIQLYDLIEKRLVEMKELALYAKDHQEDRHQVKQIQQSILLLQEEIRNISNHLYHSLDAH